MYICNKLLYSNFIPRSVTSISGRNGELTFIFCLIAQTSEVETSNFKSGNSGLPVIVIKESHKYHLSGAYGHNTRIEK